MAYLPPFVDEFTGETGRVTDCVPASGLMGVNKRTHGKYPATAAEREGLQADMGTTNLGATAAQLAAGVKKRYGLTIAYGNSWTIIAAALRDPARGVAIFGSYTALPLALRQHGRQPTFAGLHCMYAQALDPATGTTTVGDPLATSYYNGVTIDQLKAYCAGLNYMYALFVEEAAEVVITQNPIPSTFWQAKGGPLTGYKPGAAPLTKTFATGSQASTTAIAVKVDPAAGWPHPPLLYVSTGGLAGYYIAQEAVTFTPPPDPNAALTQELAATKAELAVANTRIAGAKNALGA